MISQYTSKLIERKEIASETMQVFLEKPKGFVFTPGQYVFLDFKDPKHTDDCPTFRAMSIAAAPHEDFLLFVMRKSDSAFKKNIAAMEAGDEIIIKGPMGHMMLPTSISKPAVFLVGGVGITPARSMIKYEEYQKSKRKITLIYGSRTKQTIALNDEMSEMDLENYKPVFILSQEEGEWDGEKGRITRETLEKYVDDIKNSMYYIVGNKRFGEAMKELLDELDITKENIQFDNFG